ncbi:MFS transporter [Oceanospirillum sp. D5]|uniref:MFS transporter n=1 Tax=Oceanospirillum sediminis TaxID=2760088 RepID=A0A839IZP6_9GAMM|nr:MFS transporter [Oceanospirillum sediminis]
MPSPPLTPEKWTPTAIFTLVILGLSAGLQLSDQGVQSLSLSAIQNTFDTGDTALGSLQGVAGFLIGSLLAIPLSRLVDKYSRKRILLSFIFASATLMALSALAPNFSLFFLGRASAGILEFAMIPLVYSMIPDLAPEQDRVLANLGFAAIMAIGASGGYYFGDVIIATGDAIFSFEAEPWRKGLLLLSVAGLPLFLLALLTQNPARYPGLVASSPSDSIVQFLRQRWKTMVLFMGAAGCMVIAVQALNQLIALAMERRFDADITSIGQAMGIILLIVSAGSIPAAGLLDRLLGRVLQQASRPGIMALGAITSIPAAVALNATAYMDQAFIIIGVFIFLTATANALVPTLLQDLLPAAIRARSFAIWSFLVSTFSASGPLLSGGLSDVLFDHDLLLAITMTTVPALCLSAFFALQLVRELRENKAL